MYDRDPKQVANKVGKQALTGGAQPQSSTVGKHTLVERNISQTDTVFRTGNSYADQGTACEDTPNRKGCVLAPSQRQRVLGEYGQRVTAAQIQYTTALVELKIDELLKKEKAEPSLLMDMLLDVITSVAGGSVMRAAGYLLSGAGKDMLTSLVEDTDEAMKSIKEVTKDQVDKTIDKAVEYGKEQVESSKPPDPEKQATQTYLSLLQNASIVTYQHLKEDALAGVTDGLLLAMWRSFEGINHTASDYKAKLKSKLDRFRELGASQLGVREAEATDEDQTAGFFDPIHVSWVMTKAFWVRLPHGQKLALYRRHKQVETRPDEYDKGLAWEGGLRVSAATAKQDEKDDEANNPFGFWKWVPKEFEKAVVQMHEAAWNSPPEQRAGGMGEIISSLKAE